MSKTPRQLAAEYCDKTNISFFDRLFTTERNIKIGAFLSGYKAAQDQVLAQFKLLLSSFAETSFNPSHTAWQMFDILNDQVADVSKVITYDYVETASNEAKELITKFELKGDEDVLVKALVAAYCRGVDAVDGYLRNSLSAYRASVKQQQWISVKDRLPEENQ